MGNFTGNFQIFKIDMLMDKEFNRIIGIPSSPKIKYLKSFQAHQIQFTINYATFYFRPLPIVIALSRKPVNNRLTTDTAIGLISGYSRNIMQ